MENEAEWTAARIELYHLMKAHPDWGYRAYARELGRDPGWARKWCLRIRGAKTLNLDIFKGRSRAPKHTQCMVRSHRGTE